MEAPIGTIIFLYHLVIEESKKRKADEELKQKKKREEELRKKRAPMRNIPKRKLNNKEQASAPLADISMEDLEDELS